MTAIKKVLVVGAGPTGLLLALLLAQQSIPVEIFESAEAVDDRPRGIAYGPSTSPLPDGTRLFRRAGVLEELRRRARDIEKTSWRELGGKTILELTNDRGNPNRLTFYPVDQLSNLLLKLLSQQPTARVRLSHPVVGVSQNDISAWVDVQTANGIVRFDGDFVVGADGASSTVRKSLFGDDFPGFTWDKQLVVTNVYYNMDIFDWSDVQWIIDPEDWGMVAAISNVAQVWRVAYGEPTGLSHEELRSRLPKRFEKLLPGSPKPNQYTLLRFSPFVVHQRCARKMAVGRVMLVGDAAHLCNPMGGLGLTGGMGDVGSLADCLLGLHNGQADLEILEKYDAVRRSIYDTIIDPVSSANFKRLWNKPDDIRDSDSFFKMARQAADDPSAAEKMQMMDIAYDMTQHYNVTAERKDSKVSTMKIEDLADQVPRPDLGT